MITSPQPTSASTPEEIVAVLEIGRGETESPRFTMLDHGLQCAAVLAEQFPDDLELQIAGLLHDIGHTLMPGAPDLHGEVAGAFVRPMLGERVAELVRLHVDAKRFLVAVEPEYRDQLSEGSAQTLIAQGEAMTPTEVEAYRVTTHADDAITLRRADEMAKVPGRVVPQLDEWVPVLTKLCQEFATSSDSRAL